MISAALVFLPLAIVGAAVIVLSTLVSIWPRSSEKPA
jgi:hypothetical protein